MLNIVTSTIDTTKDSDIFARVHFIQFTDEKYNGMDYMGFKVVGKAVLGKLVLSSKDEVHDIIVNNNYYVIEFEDEKKIPDDNDSWYISELSQDNLSVDMDSKMIGQVDDNIVDKIMSLIEIAMEKRYESIVDKMTFLMNYYLTYGIIGDMSFDYLNSVYTMINFNSNNAL